MMVAYLRMNYFFLVGDNMLLLTICTNKLDSNISTNNDLLRNFFHSNGVIKTSMKDFYDAK